jgi:hypothetical protein
MFFYKGAINIIDSPPSNHILLCLHHQKCYLDTKGPFRGLLLDLLLQFYSNQPFPFDNVLDTIVMGSDNPALKKVR